MNRKMVIGILLVGAVFYLFWSQVFIHDWYLWQFSRSYRRIAHPPMTQRLKYHTELGLLIANGNHIDLFAGELRSYSGSPKDIQAWYAAQSVPSQLAKGERVPVAVYILKDGKIPSEIDEMYYPDCLSTLTEAALAQPHGTHLYVVYVLDATGYDPGFDIRGM
jgi:hypothetical protein